MGPMKKGCPVGEGIVVDASHTRFRVAFDGSRQVAGPKRVVWGSGAAGPIHHE